MPVTSREIKTLGPTRLLEVEADVTASATAEQESYPNMEGDALANDRMYRIWLSSVFIFEHVGGTAANLGALLQDEGNLSATLFLRHWLTSEDTASPADLQGSEFLATATTVINPDLKIPSIVLPPGVRTTIYAGASAFTTNKIYLEGIVAESPDPRDLYPYINARTGGISGLWD